MKNNLLLTAYAHTVLFLFCNLNSNAQKGFYCSIGAGYGFDAAGYNSSFSQGPAAFEAFNQTSTDTYFQSSHTTYTSETENVQVGFGKGFNFAGTIGYKFNEHFS